MGIRYVPDTVLLRTTPGGTLYRPRDGGRGGWCTCSKSHSLNVEEQGWELSLSDRRAHIRTAEVCTAVGTEHASRAGIWEGWPKLKDQDKVNQKITHSSRGGARKERKRSLVTYAEGEQGISGLYTFQRRHGYDPESLNPCPISYSIGCISLLWLL